MNISVVEQKEGYVKLQVDLSKEDYNEDYKKELKCFARGAKVDGFRNGKVPVGMIEKMYGEAVRNEVINRVVGKGISDFSKEHEYKEIGWAMPEDANAEALQNDPMTLVFNLALYPTEYDFDLSDKTFTKYEVSLSDEDVDKALRETQEHFSGLKDIDEVVEEAIVGGDIAELDGDTKKEGGIIRENVTVYPRFMKSEEERKKFIGASKGSVVVFKPYEAFDGNEAELTSLLNVEKDTVEELKGKEFSFQIETIRNMVPAELGEEFYNQAFGEDTVHNEEEAKQKIREDLQKTIDSSTENKLIEDIMESVRLEKAPKLSLADDLIVEWYNDSKRLRKEETSEDRPVDKEALISTLKQEIYVEKLAEKEDVKVTQEEIKDFARLVVKDNFAQMGWNIPAELLETYTNKQLENANFAYNVEKEVLSRKVGAAIKDGLKIETKQVTADEFTKMLRPNQAPSEETSEADSKE